MFLITFLRLDKVHERIPEDGVKRHGGVKTG